MEAEHCYKHSKCCEGTELTNVTAIDLAIKVGRGVAYCNRSALTELTPHPGVQRAGQGGCSVGGWLLRRLGARRLLRLLVGRHHLLVMGRSLLALLLTHVVVYKMILRCGLVIVMRVLVLIRLHVMLRRSLLMVCMLLLRMMMILMTVVIERCLWGAI